MRCGLCGLRSGPDRLMAAGPGIAVCGACAKAAVQLAPVPRSSRSAADRPARPGWGRGRLDRRALQALSREELAAELGLVREIMAPLTEFVDAATARLAELEAQEAQEVAAAVPEPPVPADEPVAGPGSGAGPPAGVGPTAAAGAGVVRSDPAGGGAPSRAAGSHTHHDAVALPDGTVIHAASLDPDQPYRRRRTPDHGLYLDQRWHPPWPHDHVDWPDRGLPADRVDALAALASLLARARRGQHVELGSLGGHGRTGTALACLAAMAGLDPADAVAWTRTTYCPAAVETDGQAAFVRAAFPSRRRHPDLDDPW